MTRKKMPSFMGPLIAAILLSIVLAIISSTFLSINNLMNILRQASISMQWFRWACCWFY